MCCCEKDEEAQSEENVAKENVAKENVDKGNDAVPEQKEGAPLKEVLAI